MKSGFFPFLNRIKKGDDVPLVSILYGYNEFLGEDIIRAYCSLFLEDKNEFNYRRYYFDKEEGTSWDQILQEASSANFFLQSRKVIVATIRSSDFFNKKKSDNDKKIETQQLEDLAAYLRSPNPDTALIIYVSLTGLKDDISRLMKSKVKPFIEKVASSQTAQVNLDQVNEGEIRQHIQAFFRERGISISSSALDRLHEIKGDDFISILQQLPKFELISDIEKGLQSEDVEEFVTGITSHSIWSLTEAIENEDVVEYLNILNYLFINGVKPAYIIGTLITYYNKIFLAKFLLKANFSLQDVGQAVNQRFYLNELARQVRRFSDGRLARVLGLIYKLDLDAKTAGEDMAILALQNFIFQIKSLRG